MKYWVGVTDDLWFEFLRDLQPKPDEVSFWHPSGKPPFTQQTSLFLFKLHAPRHFIVGGGIFSKAVKLPLSILWEVFDKKNGRENFSDLREIVTSYRNRHKKTEHPNPEISSSIILEPFFWQEKDWIDIHHLWKPGLVQGKFFNTENLEEDIVWQEVQQRLVENLSSTKQFRASEPAKDYNSDDLELRYGKGYVIRPRIGQGLFRISVIDAYQRRCSMTGERTLPVLEAAHIKPYSLFGPHLTNGLLLRADLHKLFDNYYITITTDSYIEVSSKIKEEYENGREYYKLHGKKLEVLPENPRDKPSFEYLEWHNSKFVS